jgi:LacI family transcriptional regulator
MADSLPADASAPSSAGSSGRITIRQVAEAVGVAESTVSRALAGHPAVRESTRAAVLEASRRLGYPARKPALPQPALLPARGDSRAVGVVVAALQNQFFPFFVDYLHDALRALGFHMTLIIDDFARAGASSAFEPLFRRYLAGVVLATATTDSRIAVALHEAGIPLVLAVRSVDGLEADCVQIDNVMAGELAAQHLLELGHTRFGFVMGPPNTSTSRERLLGARRAIAAQGLLLDEAAILPGAYTHASGYSGVTQLLAAPDPPTAIICGNDTVAIGGLEAARRHGVAVPGRLSIIGFDDIPMAGWAMIGLTTVRQPMAEMAATAAQRLAERIAGGNRLPPRRDLLPVSLVQRGSTGPTPD